MSRRRAAAALACALLAGGCTPKPSAIPDILGQVNDEYLTTDEFMHHLKLRGGMSLDGEPRGALKRFVLAELIDRKLLLQEARRQGIKPSREDVRGAFAEQGGRGWEKPDRERAWNVEDDLVEQRQIERLLREALPVRRDPGAAAVRAYLNEHPDLLTRQDQVKIRQFVVHSAAMARTIELRRKDGDDFGDLARAAGEKVNAAAWMGAGDLPEPVQKALSGARDGRMVGPVATDYGWNVVQLTARRPAGPVRRGDAVEAARQRLLADARREATEKLVARLRSRAMIRVDMAAVAAL